jgi:hypothetical protein
MILQKEEIISIKYYEKGSEVSKRIFPISPLLHSRYFDHEFEVFFSGDT